MKNLIRPIAIMVSVGVACSCAFGALKEPAYQSKKPLYAKVVLDEAGTKILKLVFDESGGPGRDYDTIYADLNLNNDLTDDKPIKGKLRRETNLRECSFPPVEIAFPYNEKASGVEKPWTIEVSYFHFAPASRLRRGRAPQELSLSCQGTIGLKDESGEWQYSWRDTLPVAEKPNGILALAFGGAPSVRIGVKPDPEKKGNVGIAAYLVANGVSVGYTKAGKAATAHVKVTGEQDNIVHSEEVALEKLRFG